VSYARVCVMRIPSPSLEPSHPRTLIGSCDGCDGSKEGKTRHKRQIVTVCDGCMDASNMMDRKEKWHDLSYGEYDEIDEVSGDEMLTLVWCNTHRTWEWHWVPRDAPSRARMQK
jgi:hypothetical protein